MQLVSKKTFVGIIPAAGTATRFGGAPKFLLPSPEKKSSGGGALASKPDSMIRLHAKMQSSFCDVVVIVTRPEWHQIVQKQVTDMKDVLVLSCETKSLGATIRIACSVGSTFTQTPVFFLSLPDTYFDFEGAKSGLESLTDFGSDLQMLCWKTGTNSEGRFGEVELAEDGQVTQHVDKPGKTQFKHFWGALVMSPRFVEKIGPESESLSAPINEEILGQQYGGAVRSVVVNSAYYDLGTIAGYQDLLLDNS